MVFPVVGGNESKGYDVENSLRFNDDDSAKLSLAFGSGGNTKTWTVSCWFKRGVIGSRQSFLNVGSSGSEYMSLYIDSEDKLYWVSESGGNLYRIGSSALFRDPSAWYHCHIKVDTTQGTAANRVIIHINGVERTYSTATYPNQNATLEHLSNGETYYIGGDGQSSDKYFDGYITEINHIDGFAYDPSYFGQTDPITGQWNPKKYGGSYGTNGFYLNVPGAGTAQNSSGMGGDSSGNDHHFASSGLAANSSVTDTPTNNFCNMSRINVSHFSD